MAIYKLGDICDIFTGKSWITSKYIKENQGTYAVISSKTTNNGVYGNINTFQYKQGITISKDGIYSGTVFFQKDYFSITCHAFTLQNIKEVVITNFLFLFLKKHEKNIQNLAQGSTRDGLSKTSLQDFIVKIPSLKTQKQVIDIIKPLEQQMTLLEKSINLYKKYSNHIIQNLTKHYIYNHFNENNYKLGDIANIRRGRIINSNDLQINSGIYPVISSNTKNNGIFGFINTYDYDGEYITISADGIYAGTPFYQNGKFSITNVCFILDKKEKNLYLEKFLFYYLKIKLKNEIKSMSSGATRVAIRAYNLVNLRISIPKLEIQKQVISIIKLNLFNKLIKFFKQKLRRKKWNLF